jgi:hypothetical protein
LAIFALRTAACTARYKTSFAYGVAGRCRYEGRATVGPPERHTATPGRNGISICAPARMEHAPPPVARSCVEVLDVQQMPL